MIIKISYEKTYVTKWVKVIYHLSCFDKCECHSRSSMTPMHKSIALPIIFTNRIVSTAKAVAYHVLESSPDVLKLIWLQLHIHQHMHNPSQSMRSTPVLLSIPFKHQRASSLPTQCPSIFNDFIDNHSLKKIHKHNPIVFVDSSPNSKHNKVKNHMNSWRPNPQYNWKELSPDQDACLRTNTPIENQPFHITTRQEDLLTA